MQLPAGTGSGGRAAVVEDVGEHQQAAAIAVGRQLPT
jgi:hypothetical protein